MRPKAFWESRLKEARAFERTLDTKIDALTVQIRALDHRIRHLKQVKLKKKSRDSRAKYLTKLAKARAELKQLRTTKIPYYERMIAREPKTKWERIRQGGLSVVTPRLAHDPKETAPEQEPFSAE